MRYLIEITNTNGKNEVTFDTFDIAKSELQKFSDDLIENRAAHLPKKTSYKLFDVEALGANNKPQPFLHHFIDVFYPTISLPSKPLQ